MRILIVAPNWIGDAVMAQPLLRRLRHDWPTADLEALAPPHVAGVLECMPEIDWVHAAALAHGRLQWRERRALASKFKGYDRAYVLPNSLKSALIPWLAGIPVRIGYTGESRYGLLNRRLRNGPRHGARIPMVEHYAALAGVDALGSAPAGSSDFHNAHRPRLAVDDASIAIAKAKFLAGASMHIGFCPGAEFGPAKRWPAVHFAGLADLIAQHHPQAQIACLGGPKDKDIAHDIAQASKTPVLNLCGQTTLVEVIAVMKSMRAIVTNDSGLMHVAAALDVPVVALYGSTDPGHTPPHSPLATILRTGIECSPCFARTCPLGHMRCLNDLTPNRVWDALAPCLASPGLASPGLITAS